MHEHSHLLVSIVTTLEMMMTQRENCGYTYVFKCITETIMQRLLLALLLDKHL